MTTTFADKVAQNRACIIALLAASGAQDFPAIRRECITQACEELVVINATITAMLEAGELTQEICSASPSDAFIAYDLPDW